MFSGFLNLPWWGDLVTGVYPLDDAAEAFAAASSGLHVKVVVTTDPAAAGGGAHR